MGRLRNEIEDRIETRSLLMLAVVAWISVEAFDAAPEQLAATMIGSAIAGGAGLVADAFDLRDGVRYGGLGLASLFGAVALFAATGAVALPAALGLVGLWLALDGVQSVRHAGIEEPAETQPDGVAVYRRYLRRRIRELLGNRPRSRTELREAMDADPDDIDAALGELQERDLVSLQAGAYHRDAPESPGRLPRARNWLIKSARRLARPVTAEFRSDDPYGEREETTPDTATSHGEWGSRSAEIPSDDRTESAGDEERVRQRERE